MIQFLALMLAGVASVSAEAPAPQARRLPARHEAAATAQTYWRREGTGWRRVTRERDELLRHEWAPALPERARTAEAPLAPSGLFRPWVARETGSWPEAVAIGDLNQDGRKDVALITSSYFDPANDYMVHVFLQTPTGDLAPSVKYPVTATSGGCRSIDVGDVTGDGRDDVVVGANQAVEVLRQNVGGTLDAPVSYATPSSLAVKIADFNHDGRKDVAAIAWGTSDVAVFLQNTGGTLDAPVSYPAPHGGYDDLEAGDVNNDGLADIVVMSGQLYAIDNLAVLLQNPTGGFNGPFTYDLGLNENSSGAEVADVNGDGRNDVVITYGGNQPAFIAVFPQNATSTLNPPFSLAAYDIPEPVESADLDGNGRTDLAVLHGGYNTMGVYLQGNGGALAAEALEPVPYASHYQPQGVALGDINNDGRADAVIADYNNGLVVLYQKSAYDLGLTIDGPPSAGTGAEVSYLYEVKNYGFSTATGVSVHNTMSSGLTYLSSEPPGVCSASGPVVTCPLQNLAPGQTTSVRLIMTGIQPGAQSNQATVASAQQDGYPADNAALFTTQFLGSCLERVLDGGFELGFGGPWAQSSTNFGTPLCTFGDCGDGGGTAGPRSGAWWSWFGGIDVFEQGVVSQVVTLPVGTAHLRFYLWIGIRSGNNADSLRAFVDGVPVFTVTDTTPGYATYTLVDVDVSAFATGGTHQLLLRGITQGPGVTNFNVDDVSVEWCPLPSLSITDAAAVTEGNAGPVPAAFSVSLSQPSAQPVTVNWATGAPATGVPATAGSDYTAASGQLSFPPGTVSLPVTISVLGDTLDEFDETFGVNLSGPTGATLADGAGLGTIADDDPLPGISIGDVIATEGQTGTTPAQFPVSLTVPSGRAVSGTFTTANGTALAGLDYTASSGGFTVPAGALSSVIAVPVVGDTLDELDETFTATIAAPDFAVLGDAQGQATIDDDDGPSVRVGDASVTEGNAGSVDASFDVTLSAASLQPVTMSYATADGTATAGADYTAVSGSITFVPGATAASVAVPVLGDLLDEPNESFELLLSNVVDGTSADAAGSGLIVDDDGAAILLSGDLSHGFDRRTDLAATPAAARHLYRLSRPPRSSWEVVVEGTSGDLDDGTGSGPLVRRLASDLTTVLQPSAPVGVGSARTLTVPNMLASAATDYVEVRSAGCTTDCGTDDVYRIRVRETTLAAPRFNNAGAQVTVVVLQNTTAATVSGTLWFWGVPGGLLGNMPFVLGARQSLALNSALVGGVAGQGGTITVTHDGPYGGLVGKAVALEASTGFTFDTPLEPRRR